jgi:hypothetical protein
MMSASVLADKIDEIIGAELSVVSRVFRTFGLAEQRPALAQAVMAPLICWSFSSSMFK